MVCSNMSVCAACQYIFKVKLLEQLKIYINQFSFPTFFFLVFRLILFFLYVYFRINSGMESSRSIEYSAELSEKYGCHGFRFVIQRSAAACYQYPQNI